MFVMSNNLERPETENSLIFLNCSICTFIEILGGGSLVAKYAFAHGASQTKDDLMAAFKLIKM